jgi:hypothetical protein
MGSSKWPETKCENWFRIGQSSLFWLEEKVLYRLNSVAVWHTCLLQDRVSTWTCQTIHDSPCIFLLRFYPYIFNFVPNCDTLGVELSIYLELSTNTDVRYAWWTRWWRRARSSGKSPLKPCSPRGLRLPPQFHLNKIHFNLKRYTTEIQPNKPVITVYNL